ncbi:hypothetical protein F4859DRAFT_487289 [Xylaria cf. heliscus]|nr:hypothetical protein F4859DRAFT_487289 [Xylaria cf. heliscus]
MPTVHEFVSHAKVVMQPISLDIVASGVCGDLQVEKSIEVASRIHDLQRQVPTEKVDLGSVMYVMKLWIIQIMAAVLGYRGNRPS